MALASREDLKQYCLRALGSPVVNINVDDEQLEDRIDEALEYWRLYHPEGVEEVYIKYMITASVITITTNNAGSFFAQEQVKGATSGATAILTSEGKTVSAGNTLLVGDILGTFIDGETITGASSGVSATLALTNSVVKGVYDNKYITLPDLLYGVTRVIPMAQTSSSKNMFDLQYQLRLHDLYDVTSTSLVYYKTMMNHLDLIDFELNAKPNIRYNRFTNVLHIDTKWIVNSAVGDFIIVDGYMAMDPTSYPKLWNEIWLKHYVTSLFKKQWGTNLSKFSGLQLPGGVTLDGPSIHDDAVNEIKDLEEELLLKAAPCSFFTG